MVNGSATNNQSWVENFKAGLMRNKQWIIACMCAAFVGGLVCAFYFTGRNMNIAVSLASTVISLIFAGAGAILGEKRAGYYVTLAGVLVSAAVYCWGFNDLVRPYEHSIVINNVGSGYALDFKDCDFSNPKLLVCKLP